MRYTTLDYLNVVAPYIPAELASEPVIAKISEVAANLPLSSNFGFECRLGSDVPDADFLVAIIPSDGSRAAWAGENPLIVLSAEPSTSTWGKVHRLLADWHRGTCGLDPIHDTWLEFDIEARLPELPEPSFFFGFDDTAPINYPELAKTLVERLLERPLTGRQLGRLRICYAALPPQALIFQVGIMLSRAADEIRLCTRGLGRRQIVEYLGRIGWPGSLSNLRDYIEYMAPRVDNINLDISLGETVSPHIGLECPIRSGAAGRARLKSLLAELVDSAVCVPSKKEGLLRWLGYCTEHTDRPRWPVHLLKGSRMIGEGIVSSFARTLNHLKITYSADGTTTAKAYLGVRHFWSRMAD